MKSSRIRIILFLILVMSLVVSSCVATNVVYISDAQIDSSQTIIRTYSTTIHQGDQLSIYVSSLAPESAIPFNQKSHTELLEKNVVNQSESFRDQILQAQETYRKNYSQQLNGYLVSEKGTILFPVLGELYVEGLTQDSLERKIEQLLIAGNYIYDPVVTVDLMNLRVSVVGEVSSPQELHIEGDRLTILEALAMCGDMTIYGQRDKVVVLREENGEAKPIQIDLTQKSMFDSDVYYLQSNDIVYVEPNKVKGKMANQGDTSVLSYTGLLIAISASLWNIIRSSFGHL